MDSCKVCNHQRVFLNVKKQNEGKFTTILTPSSTTQRVDSVTINLSCDTRINTWVPTLGRVVEQRQPLILNSVRVVRPQTVYSDTTHNAVKEAIKGWNMSNYEQESMIKKVLSNVRDEVKTVSIGCNSVDVLVEVIVVHDHTVVQEEVYDDVLVDDLFKTVKKTKGFLKTFVRYVKDLGTKKSSCFCSSC